MSEEKDCPPMAPTHQKEMMASQSHQHRPFNSTVK